MWSINFFNFLKFWLSFSLLLFMYFNTFFKYYNACIDYYSMEQLKYLYNNNNINKKNFSFRFCVVTSSDTNLDPIGKAANERVRSLAAKFEFKNGRLSTSLPASGIYERPIQLFFHLFTNVKKWIFSPHLFFFSYYVINLRYFYDGKLFELFPRRSINAAQEMK